VLDTGALTRGSGSKNEDRERNIRKWFVDRDLIDGVILLPDNLFYNTTAAGAIIVLNKRKGAARKNHIVLMNASRRVRKGSPKNFIPDDFIRPIALAYHKGEGLEGEVAVVARERLIEADYNLNPGRWVGVSSTSEVGSISALLSELTLLDDEARRLTASIAGMLARVTE
jgi:type I restriction enzyme M protein